jgi:two-component system, OmpR family, sensor kinase
MQTSLRPGGGLPIAAYLGFLVALALASAFVAVLAIVIWLPPRPPDVTPADTVADEFRAGYDFMLAEGRPLPSDSLSWFVQRNAPDSRVLSSHLQPTQFELANSLALAPEQVRVGASSIVRNETFVFRVRDLEEIQREVARAERDAHRAERAVERESHWEEHRARIEAIREAQQEAAEAMRAAREANADGGGVIIRTPSPAQVEVYTERGGPLEVRIPRPPPPAPPSTTSQPPSAAVVPAPPMPPIFAPPPRGAVLISDYEVSAQLPDGRWLVMRQGRNWAEISWIARAAGIIGGTLLTLSLLAVWFARRLTRPIRSFSDAVQAVGVDPQSEPVREEGPRELRGAARAINTMQARLRTLIADRTKTLAAVAHDMRTPLMRLRLVAENAPPEQRERMAKEIGEVESLVASFIAFARDDPAEEARVRLDLSALLQSIADDRLEAGFSVSYADAERVIITGQSLGLKRLFANLVDNALKFGASARITLMLRDRTALVDIDDDGPGIPADQRDAVFEPFVRLNEGMSGAGLGLAAARGIARAHGGEIVILDSERGAKVRVTLPA